MSRIHVAALLGLSALFPFAIAHGQVIFGGGNSDAISTSTQGSATERAVPQCQAAPGGSRMRRRDRGGCEELAEAQVQTEQQINISLEAPQVNELQCEATTSTEYSQRNTVVRVTGTVDITNCPAGSAGTFNVVARVKDESGEIKPLEFQETWQRDDATDVAFTSDYPIGDNVDLVNVRVRNLRCTCAEAAVEAAASATPPPN